MSLMKNVAVEVYGSAVIDDVVGGAAGMPKRSRKTDPENGNPDAGEEKEGGISHKWW